MATTDLRPPSRRDPSSLPPRVPGRRWRFLAAVAIGWGFVAAVDVGLIFGLARRWGDRQATDAATPRYVAFEVTAAGAWTVALAVVAAVGEWAAGRLPPRGRRVAAVAVPAVVTTAGLAAVGCSWASFWSNGTFIDREAVAFLGQLMHPLRTLQTVSPWLSIGVPLAAVAVGVTGTAAVGRALRRVRPSTARRFVMAAVVVGVGVGVYALMATVGSPARGAAAPAGQRQLLAAIADSPDHVWNLLRHRAGPCATALLDLTGLDAAFTTAPRAAAGVEVVYRPRITTAQYLARVDRSAVRPLNVVVVEVESLRADVLRAYGGTAAVMPTVDALAAESVAFADARTQATHSNYAVACPLSGQYPLRSAWEYTYPVNPTYPRVMIYDLLKAAVGYRVGLFSSGNEHWFGMVHFLRTPAVDAYQDAETAGAPTRIFAEDSGFAQWAKAQRAAGVVDDRFTVDSTIRWIDAGPGPFFAYLNLQSSHFPYWVPPDFPRRFGPAKADFTMNFGHYPPEKAGVVRGMYYDSLRYADDQLARLFDHLRATGAWARTLVVLTGDHGQGFYEHGFPTHAMLPLAELDRVPLLFRTPGVAPRVDPYPAQHVDVPPSVLHLLGLPDHPGYQGLDLFAADRPAHRSRFTMSQSPISDGYAILRDGYKLLLDKRSNTYALYDESADPADRTDVLAAHADLARHLSDRLETWGAVQLDYYNNPLRQAQTYAPVLPDP